MKMKIVSILSILILFTTNTYATSVNLLGGGIAISIVMALLPEIILSFFLAHFIPKILKKPPSGILKNIFVRAFIAFLVSTTVVIPLIFSAYKLFLS